MPQYVFSPQRMDMLSPVILVGLTLFLNIYPFCSENAHAASLTDGNFLHTEKKEPFRKTSSPHMWTQRSHALESVSDRYKIRIEYPSVGFAKVDHDIALWAIMRANAFTNGVEQIPADDTSRLSLAISFKLTHISDHCFSVIYYIMTETGNAYTEQAIATFTYELANQRLLTYEDIFGQTENLLPFLSSYAYNELSRKAAGMNAATRVYQGTRPEPINFAYFALSPDGLCLYFPPKQVASDEYGTLKVTIPLAALHTFKPKLSLWEDIRLSPSIQK